MRITIAALALLAGSCAAMNDHGHHEVVWVDYGPDPMQNPEFNAARMQAMMPGEVHAELAKGVGHYQVDMRMWMAPGTEPMPMPCTANVEMILGGRYLKQEFKGNFMGEEFEGLMLMGYDNLTDEYWSLWIDNMRTGYSLSIGREDENGNQVMNGWMRDPRTPQGRPLRSVTVPGENGSFVVHMYDSLPDGGEFEVMEMTYRK
jgi:hypothetical protein